MRHRLKSFLRTKAHRWVFAASLILLTASLLVSWINLQYEKNRLEAEFLSRMQTIAEALDTEQISRLSGEKGDFSSIEYKTIARQLNAVQIMNRDFMELCVVVMKKDGGLFSYSSSHTDFESKDTAKPEKPAPVSRQPGPDTYHDVFKTGKPVVLSLFSEKTTNEVRALLPVRDRKSDRIYGILEAAASIKTWTSALLWSLAIPLLVGLSLSASLMTGVILVNRRNTLGQEKKRHLRYIEPIVALLFGIILTLSATIASYRHELDIRYESFSHLSAIKMKKLREMFYELNDIKIDGLAHFIENNEEISREGFESYTRYLTKAREVQGWGWVPRVPESERINFEHKLPAGGMNHKKIWQRSHDGKAVPAEGRSEYYPILYEAPFVPDSKIVGYDLGSEPERKAALTAAYRTGMITGTGSLALIKDNGKEKGMIVFRPIYHRREPGRLRGFAIAAVRFNLWLKEL
ncbi:MAG: CHASE domain-containing protein, partial [Oligoflexales bacterium]|nr:CHASE domain-containing protein [Oligoflexales bacterium]